LFAIALVITSGLLHAVWNLFAKQSLDKVVFLWSIQRVAVSRCHRRIAWCLRDAVVPNVRRRGPFSGLSFDAGRQSATRTDYWCHWT